MKTYQNLKFLDSIRGLAALYVLIHHARLLLMQPFYNAFLPNIAQYNWFNKYTTYAMAIFKFGHEAVIIFFVLSGFVIHLKQASPNHNTFDYKNYFKKRIIRIYPTVITAMLITFCCAYLYATISKTNLEGYKLNNFLYNLTLIPDLPIWGNNYPIWSLQHEWFFYLIYPILLFLNRKNTIYGLIIPIALFVTATLKIKIPLLHEATATLLLWWLGALLAEVFTGKINLSLTKLKYITVPAVILIFSPLNNYILLHNLFFSVSVIGILAYMLTKENAFLNPFNWLGNFSFSLYLIHFPIQMLIKNSYLFYYKELPHNIGLALFGTVISILIIYPIYLLTEKKAQNFKTKEFYSAK